MIGGFLYNVEGCLSYSFLRSHFESINFFVDVKNWESPQPFAFIQFADIQSVVRAINAQPCGGKGKTKVCVS